MAHMMRPASVAFGMKRKVEVKRPIASSTRLPKTGNHNQGTLLRKEERKGIALPSEK